MVNPRFTKVTAATAIPGDLVFFGGSAATVHHVGVYTGTVNGVAMMVNAPETASYVRDDTIASHSDLLGYYHLTG